MDKRVFGLENEYAILAYCGGQVLPLGDVLDEFERFLGWEYQFRANGSRLYLDGEHPEYATPECTTLHELVTHDKAGERLMEASRSTSSTG